MEQAFSGQLPYGTALSPTVEPFRLAASRFNRYCLGQAFTVARWRAAQSPYAAIRSISQTALAGSFNGSGGDGRAGHGCARFA